MRRGRRLLPLLLAASLAPPVRAADVSCDTAPAAPPIVVQIPTDLREARAAERAFATGQQPWRGDPRLVAYFEIGTALERDVRLEDMRVEAETEVTAIVSGQGSRCWYRVSLSRPTGPRGPWMAVELEYARGVKAR
jgi:hypothetical protein